MVSAGSSRRFLLTRINVSGASSMSLLIPGLAWIKPAMPEDFDMPAAVQSPESRVQGLFVAL